MSIKTFVNNLLKRRAVEKHTPTVRELITERTEDYNESIKHFIGVYMDDFCSAWRRSINSIRIKSIDKIKDSDCTFEVVDKYQFRPKEAWELFLDSVLSKHPDLTFEEKKSGDLMLIVFHYINCLDDVIDE